MKPKLLTPRVTFLGTGDAFSAGGGRHAAYLVEGSRATVLLDCGPSILAALEWLTLDVARVDAVLVSHLHGDHTAGLPFLFLEYTYDRVRTRPLIVAGPPGTEAHVWSLLEATYRRLTADRLPFPVQFIELRPGSAAVVAGVAALPFRVPHQEDAVSLGLRITVDGRVIVYSGDSGWTDALIEQSRGADLFICECSFYETRTDTHLDYPRLAENLHQFGAGRMILSHIGREVLAHRNELAIEVASDGLCIEL